MSDSQPLTIRIAYDAKNLRGTLTLDGSTSNTVWDRFRQQAAVLTDDVTFGSTSISVPWPTILSLVREYAGKQKKWNFRLKPEQEAKAPIAQFVAQLKAVREATTAPPTKFSLDEIKERLAALGFTNRQLESFQLRDLQHLLSLHNGANFSVPGAGKTTVTFALHLLTHQEGHHLLVVCPKSSFPAWVEVVGECISDDAPGWVREPFKILSGGDKAVNRALNSGATRFVINYEQLINIQDVFATYLAQHPVHLVLDESHRMKGGYAVKKGAVLLNIATLPIRRDILSGTPMPQDTDDLTSQFDFLWPGSGLGPKIAQGGSPRQTIGSLYVRTTKEDMKLPDVRTHFVPIDMGMGQAALYGIVRDETLRNLSSLQSGSGVDIIRARRSVIRLLQLSANPVLALRSIMEDSPTVQSGIVEQVLEDGPSTKMQAVRDFARELAAAGRKSVIWTIFTDTLKQLELMLADLNPVTVYGAVPSGEPSDPATREGRIRRFNTDPACMAFIANPAAAGEGINLHHACHDAIYLDRSYNTTHFLQSIDRIHRLGLPPDILTNVYIFQTTAPKGLGCVDLSVSRRLATKLRALQQLLDDDDLHRIALYEEKAEEPIDYGFERDDLIDLIEELEGRATYGKGEGA